MKRIESRNNPTIKSTIELRTKRERERQGLFCFEGIHLLEEYLRWGKMPNKVFVREDVKGKYKNLISSLECEIYEVTESVYDKLTEEKAPQGIFTVSEFCNNVQSFGNDNAKELKGNTIIVADLQDNGNVGTIIRTAAAMDINVLLCGNCADVYSSKTVRATMGALFLGNIFVSPSCEETIRVLQNHQKRIIATALTDNAEVLGSFRIKPDDCFIIGNEGKGLPKDLVEMCNLTAIIPMSGKTESLNAAIAASMIMWEAKR